MKKRELFKCKGLLGVLVLIVFILLPVWGTAQDTASKDTAKDSIKSREIISWTLTALVIIIALYHNSRKKKKSEKLVELETIKQFNDNEKTTASKTAEAIYLAALNAELGFIHMLGSPDLHSKPVKLDDTFVTLRISEAWDSGKRFDKHMEQLACDNSQRHFTPYEVMKRAFSKYNLLLVIGDPGSGKTTLLKYYTVSSLGKKYPQMGFGKEVFPIYFPLRELIFQKDKILTLPKNLEQWAANHLLNIKKNQFHSWLQNKNCLVLLDGLDEIGSKEKRKLVCKWINLMCTGLKNARFVVTSRATGYRKLDGIELGVPHLRADIMDFSLQQQEEFLKKWYRAVNKSGLSPADMPEEKWRLQQEALADLRSNKVIGFLRKEENKAVRDLAAAPMLLQIMAILWRETEHLPRSRPALYDAALNYLLQHRDVQKDIELLLSADEARRVLAPTALFLQELKKDEAQKSAMMNFMQPLLDTLDGQPRAPINQHSPPFVIPLKGMWHI
ncbi:MAG: NACHT domain-containing protein [bacterium]|nr:NACHT domain-containing protein [bacterium]